VRKAYFRLAQKYHPDKNPTGRDMFEKINAAYEYLCSKSARVGSGLFS
jgi:DnaJ family protein C protein 13